MEAEKKFRTKGGFCHVLPDKIVLTREGFIGGIGNIAHENNVVRLRVIYIILLACLLYMAVDNLVKGFFIPAVLIIVISLYILTGLIRSANISIAPVIPREKIVNVKFKPGLTRSCFELFFKDEKGRVKKRLIVLPGSLAGRKSEAGNAVNIMKEEGFL